MPGKMGKGIQRGRRGGWGRERARIRKNCKWKKRERNEVAKNRMITKRRKQEDLTLRRKERR